MHNKRKKLILLIAGVIILGIIIFSLQFVVKVMNIKTPKINPEKYKIKLSYPTAIESDRFSKALVARGQYIAKIGDCISCHTSEVPGSIPFAGGLVMHTPFGNITTPNITPNKTEGLGNWTEKDFSNAIREGISPHGKYYYPAFPYIYFNKLTDQDTKALYAYLQSIPANNNHISNQIAFVWPFSIRFIQFGWRLLFFDFQKTGTYKINTKKSNQWNKGAYYVEGLGHCAMCHTPSYHIISSKYPLAAPQSHKLFQGSFIEGYLAPDITGSSDSRLYGAKLQDIIDVFKQNKMIGGGEILGPMRQVNNNGLSALHTEDIKSIITYLKSITPSPAPKITKVSRETGKKAIPINAKELYTKHCAICHATGVGGAPKFGNKKDWKPFLKKDKSVVLKNALHGIKAMPAKGGWGAATDSQIKAIVDYMISKSS